MTQVDLNDPLDVNPHVGHHHHDTHTTTLSRQPSVAGTASIRSIRHSLHRSSSRATLPERGERLLEALAGEARGGDEDEDDEDEGDRQEARLAPQQQQQQQQSRQVQTHQEPETAFVLGDAEETDRPDVFVPAQSAVVNGVGIPTNAQSYAATVDPLGPTAVTSTVETVNDQQDDDGLVPVTRQAVTTTTTMMTPVDRGDSDEAKEQDGSAVERKTSNDTARVWKQVA